MHFLLEYILKLSVSLAVVFLFYYFILRKLTFYNHNRWYLLGYTLLSFLIPFINISAVLQKNNWHSSEIVNWVPIINNNAVTDLPVAHSTTWGIREFVLLIIVAGMLVMLTRLLVQIFSFKKMLRKAEPVITDGMNLYQVNDTIIPFSFGNAIFINRHLHTEAELQEIIHHEFVHVKQRHSIDIIWSELLCIACWYNPFVWLLKKSIRQNLEFIADGKVLENGINKKEYQYLLLKVIGNNQYSIATPFNFSSLKKRIAMMNKTKSAKRQLIRLLFLLPATAVLLLAFRSKWNAAAKTTTDKTVAVAGLVVDAKTLQPLADAAIYCKGKNISIRTDAKGYYLLQLPFDNKELQFTLQITKDGYQSFQQEEHWGNFTQDYIFNSYSKAIAYFGLSNGAEQGFSSLTNAKDMPGLEYPAVASRLPGIFNANSPDYDETILRDTFPKRKQTNSKGYIINIADEKGNPTVVIKDKAGKEVKRVLLNEWNDNTEKYEATYGELPPPPPPPAPPMPPAAPDMPLVPAMAAPAVIPDMPVPPPPPAAPPPPPAPPKLPANVKRFDINNNKATIWLKNGQKEIYDLNNDEQKEKFEKKYGKIAAPPVPPDAALSTQADPYFGMLIKNEITPLTLSVDGKLLAAKPLPEKMLYVLNGIVATKKEIENLNQQSVAVVRFLNCEAAVAQYGTQGSEGAYLITTATPKAGSNQVLLTPAVTSMPAKSRMPVYTGAIEISNSKKMLVLDGKELATNSTKLNGVFRLLSLTKTEALEKYGGKGNNGAIEITTLK